MDMRTMFRRPRGREGIASRRIDGRWASDVFRIRTPFGIDNLDGNQTSQALLLTTAIQSGEFTADCDNGCRDGVLGHIPRVGHARFHRLNVIVVSSAMGLLAFGVVNRGMVAASGAAAVPRVLPRIDRVLE